MFQTNLKAMFTEMGAMEGPQRRGGGANLKSSFNKLNKHRRLRTR